MYSSFPLRKVYKIFVVTILLSVMLFISSASVVGAVTKPFGGRTLTAINCRNAVIYTIIGPPVGGTYIWGPFTRTFLYGPPSVGRWNLGTAGPPSICVISFDPPIFFFGLTMIMLGTSGAPLAPVDLFGDPNFGP